MKKNIVSIFLIFIMILSLGISAFAKTENEKIDWLVKKKFIQGDSKGELNLYNNLTREEAATIMVRALNKESLAPLYQSAENIFKDMKANVWSNGMVNVAVQEKIVSGFPDNTFRPKKNITYEEIIAMLVRIKGGLSEKESKSAPWPIPYILKASELDIIDSSMTNLDYKKDATRLIAFEMLYNTVKEEEFKGLNSYKAIVREVDRVYALDKNEIGLTIFNDIKNIGRYKSNEYTRIKYNNIDSVDDLLGKVINVKLDNNNNLKHYEIDNSYEYIMGKAEFTKDQVKLNGKTYDILFMDSADNVNNKLQFVYHNDKQIDYDDFYDKVESDFARITVDKNKVIAIESFNFSKVEPITKVDGSRITFTDERSTVIDNAILVKDNKLRNINIADIQNLDIGHVYGDGKILITKEIELNGKLDNVISNNGKDVIVKIDNKDHQISNKFNMLYSVDGDNFIILDPHKAYDDLYLIRGKNVRYGLDVVGHIKYIVSSQATNEDFYVADKVLSKDIRLIDKTGKSVELELGLKSLVKNSNGDNIKFEALKEGDLVYIIKDGKVIEGLYLVKDFSNMKKSSILIDKNSDGKFALDRKYIINKYTNSFLFHEENGKIKDINSMSVDKILENTKSSAKLRAYILSDYDFDNLKIGSKIITSGDKNMINTILFTGFEQSLEDSKEELVRLKYRFSPSYDNEIEALIGDKSVIYKVEKNTTLKEMSADDYVKLFINKNDKVIGAEVIFTDSDKYLEVTKLDFISGKLLEITVKENGKEKSYRVNGDYKEIGLAKKGSLVKLRFDENGDVSIILVQ